MNLFSLILFLFLFYLSFCSRIHIDPKIHPFYFQNQLSKQIPEHFIIDSKSIQKKISNKNKSLTYLSAIINLRNEEMDEKKQKSKKKTKKINQLKAKIYFIKPSIVRLKISENQPIQKRYKCSEALQENSFEYHTFKMDLQEDYVEIIIDGEDNINYNNEENVISVKLFFNPFNILVKNQDFPLFSINSDSLLRFENDQENDLESIAIDTAFINSHKVYGIPERPTDDLHLKNTTKENPLILFSCDAGRYSINSGDSLYGNVPMAIGIHDISDRSEIINPRTSSIFWMNSSETYVDIEDCEIKYEKDNLNTQGKRLYWNSQCGNIDIFLLTGKNNNPKFIWNQYFTITGYPMFPPLFSIGYNQCRWNYYTQKECYDINDTFNKHNIPYDVLWLDIDHTDEKKYFTFDKSNFPNPKKLQQDLNLDGRKTIVIVDPHIKVDESWEVYKQGKKDSLFILDSDGKEEFIGSCWPGKSAWVDFLNPKAVDWWTSLFSYENHKDSTPNLFVWNDMNEPAIFHAPRKTIPEKAKHWGGVNHRDLHNAYGLLMHKSTYQGLLEREEDKNRRPFVLTRSFFAGSQKFSAVWTGDNTSQWDHLKATPSMIANLNLAGIPFSGADTGGFFDDPTPELFVRWFQLGSLHPFFRGHSHHRANKKEPWVFGDPYTSLVRNAIQTRYKLIPLFYTLFYQSSKFGFPIIRPLWLEFGFDSITSKDNIENSSFMIGDSLLCYPILEPNSKIKSILLPRNSVCYDFFTHYKYVGNGKEFFLLCNLSTTPIYIRGGSIVPLRRNVEAKKSGTEMMFDPLLILIALDNNMNSQGFLYQDDGVSFNYQTKNEFIYQSFTFSEFCLDSKNLNNQKEQKIPEKFQLEIEEIVILGIPYSVNVNGITSDYHNEDIEFEKYQVEHGNESYQKIVIKNVNLRIGDDWKLRLNLKTD
ncbi:hypothetical protein M0811_12714 [Anaeramoeba ignava]|uniref:Glucosidase II subunit alpha n=1 Tax=Anaeramoeba ignava TaxID=1746090 RepID=A0A9Q0L915_ANAIG|nr:hypothetical protein M0811_12714 [Anaeramoeba ignava]